MQSEHGERMSQEPGRAPPRDKAMWGHGCLGAAQARQMPRMQEAAAHRHGHMSAPLMPVAATRRARLGLAMLTVILAAGPITAMATALLGPGASPQNIAILGLFAMCIAWTALAGAVALIGLAAPSAGGGPLPAQAGAPRGRTAILVPICGEPPAPVARRVENLARDLKAAGLGAATTVFVLSDTPPGPAALAEEASVDHLRSAGVVYRRRLRNTGRKPGNIADWLARWGQGFDHMIVLDSDSRMTARRIGGLIAAMEAAPDTALIQPGLRLVPGRSRFGRVQRLAARLCGPGFVTGLAAWTGPEGNYWGHNAIIRVPAFAAQAAALPRLPGKAPLGGELLSHDFIEAAWLRRAGWAVRIDPDSRGSFEDGPQQLAEFHRRDRRWCQGNLQHLRLIGAPGLHPVSRLHLTCGIMAYLAAPIWLALVLAIALGRPGIDTLAPLLGGLGLLLVPKLAGAWGWLRRGRTPGRRRVILRAAASELVLSSILAPIVLLRQTLAVAAVLGGRDCGWRPSGAQRSTRRSGLVEAGAGAALAGVVWTLAGGPAPLVPLSPILLPLLAAPVLVRWCDTAPGARRRGMGGRRGANGQASTTLQTSARGAVPAMVPPRAPEAAQADTPPGLKLARP